MDRPPLTWATFWSTWDVSPGWTLVAVLLLAGYLVLLSRARRRGERPVNAARVGSWVVGVIILWWTVCSAVGGYAMSLFGMHMLEHLMLIMVVPAFLVLGHPLSVVRGSLGLVGRPRFEAVVRSGPVRVLTHPLTAFAIYAVTIVATHLTGFMDAMSMNPHLMTAEQVIYLGAGYVYLLPLLGREPLVRELPPLMRIMLFLLGMAPDAVVGIVLMQATHDLMPMYMSMRPAWAAPAMDDQSLGGAIMWAAGDGLMMFLGVYVIINLLLRQGESGLFGSYLEGVRSSTLRSEITRSGERDFESGDVDDDDAALEAYNRMLARMNRSGTGVDEVRPGGAKR